MIKALGNDFTGSSGFDRVKGFSGIRSYGSSWMLSATLMVGAMLAVEADAFEGGVAPGDNSAGVWELYEQIEQLQNEVQQLRGVIEQQAYRLNIMQQQQKVQYLDLDRRLNRLESTGGGEKEGLAAALENAQEGSVSMASEEQFQQEKERYQAANKLVQEGKLDEAEKAFKQLLVDFPDGAFTAFAHYWLGEVYMALPQPQLELAHEHFRVVLDQYPNHAKEGATLYKLAKLFYKKGDVQKTKSLLSRAIEINPESRVAELARRYLEQIAQPAQ